MAISDIDGDLQTTLERRGISIRHVTDSAARRLILEEDIEDAIAGFAHTEMLSAANGNLAWLGRRALMAV